MNCTPFVRQVWYNTCTKKWGVFYAKKNEKYVFLLFPRLIYAIMRILYTKEIRYMSLCEPPKSRNLTQKELALQTGINFRSLQDYEPRHKKLTSANGDILLRLSTVLGCSAEELLISESFNGAPILPGNTVDIQTIQSQRFYCEKYSTTGSQRCSIMKESNIVFRSRLSSNRSCCTGL